DLLERYQTPVILAVRFMYGFRAVLPFVIGMGRIPTWRFQALNLTGAGIWSATIASARYLFGHIGQLVLGDIHRYEKSALAAVALGVLAVWWLSRRRPARRRAMLPRPDVPTDTDHR